MDSMPYINNESDNLHRLNQTIELADDLKSIKVVV